MIDSAHRMYARAAARLGFLDPARAEEALAAHAADGAGGDDFGAWLVAHGLLSDAQRQLVAEAQKAAAVASTVVGDAERSPTESGGAGGGRSAPGGGTRLGKYELLEELGRGGMGVVYRALDTELRREVALKTVLLGDAGNREVIERLLREARTAAGLDHPGIVPIHDIGTADGVPYFAMAYVRGRTLHEHLRGALDLRERARLVCDVARAVAHAHGARVIHRDLKPSNILVDDTGRTHVMDFGLAKRLDEAGGLTAAGQMLGTPQYMPPEQIEGQLDRIGPASDVYALGAVLYEALTGRPPFTGSTMAEIVARALHRDPEAPRRTDRRIHPDLETICLKALEKEPAGRYPTARELAGDLERYLNGEPIEARPVSIAARLMRRLSRHRGFVALAGAALLASAWAAWAAWERAGLVDRMRADLREKAALYVDGVASLRRSGLPWRKVEADFVRKLAQAISEYERTESGRAEPHRHLGRLYRALQRATEAEREIGAALEIDPDDPPARAERALLAVSAWHARLRAASRARLLGRDPPDAPAADLARWRAQAESAASALGREPGVDACARGLARALAGDAEGAHAAFEQAIASAPTLSEAHEGRAALLAGSDRWADAAEAFRAGCAADRGWIALRAGLVLSLLHAGDPDGARTALEEALAACPDEAELILCRAVAHRRTARNAEKQGTDPSPADRLADADFARAGSDPGFAEEAARLAGVR